MTNSIDYDRLERARDMAARLSDAELIRELQNDRGALQPEAWRALEEEQRRRRKPRRAPILTTLPDVGRPLRRVLGIVGAEYVMGVNLFQEFLAGVRDVVGGRSETMQRAMAQARETLLRELEVKASQLHADGVLGVAFTLSEWSGQQKSMLILLASGTAVDFSDSDPDV